MQPTDRCLWVCLYAEDWKLTLSITQAFHVKKMFLRAATGLTELHFEKLWLICWWLTTHCLPITRRLQCKFVYFVSRPLQHNTGTLAACQPLSIKTQTQAHLSRQLRRQGTILLLPQRHFFSYLKQYNQDHIISITTTTSQLFSGALVWSSNENHYSRGPSESIAHSLTAAYASSISFTQNINV